MRYLLLMITSILFILFSNFNLHAYNFSFMENSPAFYFEGNDVAIMEKVAIKTLDRGKSGEKILWDNPDTSAKGYFIASKPYNKNGSHCRNLKSFTDVEGVQNEMIYRFCKINNEWRIVD